jgi:glycosyltransferase involved in cell wall biosynthesis
VVGLPDVLPLLVYSGTISHARGLDTLVRGLELLPETHLAIVSVPFPHPSMKGLEELAALLGVADRMHALPPVSQSELVHYLSGASVAVHPMPGGSPNHDQALPNKLFEYLHAGLPLVVSDAKLMAAFVREHGIGEVFKAQDPASFAAAVQGALVSERREREAVHRLARAFSWQSQESVIRAYYSTITGYEGIQPTDPFPPLDVVPQLPGEVTRAHHE